MAVGALLKWKRARGEEDDSDGPTEAPQAKRAPGSPVPPTVENHPALANASGTTLKKEMALAYLAKVEKTCNANDDTLTYKMFLKLAQDFSARRVDNMKDVLTRATELFQGTYSSLLEEFKEFLQEGERITLRDYERQQFIIFKQKVQDLGSLKYAAFCNILKMFKNHSKSIHSMYESMAELFVDRSDLLEEFCRNFLPETSTTASTSQIPAGEPDHQPARTPTSTRWWWNLLTATKVRAIESENRVPGENTKLTNDGDVDLGKKQANHSDVSHRTKINPAEEETNDHRGLNQPRSKRLKLWDKEAILNWKQRQQGTPNYQLLPKNNNPRAVSQHRTELGKSVLNDDWALKNYGRDYTRVFKNQYEILLSECENEQFEFDVDLETKEMTAKKVAKYLTMLADKNGSMEALPPLEVFFSVLNRRCIEKLYVGEHFVELVSENPSRALLEMLTRLVENLEERTKLREQKTRKWSKVYKANFHLSLNPKGKRTGPSAA